MRSGQETRDQRIERHAARRVLGGDTELVERDQRMRDRTLAKTAQPAAIVGLLRHDQAAALPELFEARRLQAARFYLTVGRYASAEFFARQVCRTYPTCQEARRFASCCVACAYIATAP